MNLTSFSSVAPTAPDSTASAAMLEPDTVSRLTNWLADQIRKQSPKVLLCQILRDCALQSVEEWDVQGDIIDTRSLAEVIYGTGMREANAMRQSFAYAVVSIRPDRSGPLARFMFRIDISAQSSWLLSGEVPTERAVVGMLMTHADASARLALGHSHDILGQYQKLLKEANEHNARLLAQAQRRIDVLEKREHEALELREKMQSIQLQSEIAKRRDELHNEERKRKYDISKHTIDKLAPFAPFMVPTLARAMAAAGVQVPSPFEQAAPGSVGAAAAPPSASEAPASSEPPAGAPRADEVIAFELVQLLVASLSPSQQLQMAALLSPPQMEVFTELYNLVRAVQQARRTAAAPPAGIPGPAAQAPPATATDNPAPSSPPAPPTPDSPVPANDT